MVTHDLIGFLEGHGQRRALRRPGGGEAADDEVICLDLPRGAGEWVEPVDVGGARGNLGHEVFGKGKDGGDELFLAAGEALKILIEFPKRAVKGELGVVGQDFLDIAHFDAVLDRMGGQQERGGVGEGVEDGEGLGCEQRAKFGFLVSR